MAVMWQALFDVSSPILHTAKALHASGIKALAPAKWAAFNLFALSFLVGTAARHVVAFFSTLLICILGAAMASALRTRHLRPEECRA